MKKSDLETYALLVQHGIYPLDIVLTRKYLEQIPVEQQKSLKKIKIILDGLVDTGITPVQFSKILKLTERILSDDLQVCDFLQGNSETICSFFNYSYAKHHGLI